MEARIRLGVSSCLLGESVRYDGGHKRDPFVRDVLGAFVEWVPVCPELEAGLGVPRPPMRLVRDGDAMRLVEIAEVATTPAPCERWASARLRSLRALELCGYVLKKDSPSCGMARVKVYGNGMPQRVGAGLFARALQRAFPNLPVEEEGRLRDPGCARTSSSACSRMRACARCSAAASGAARRRVPHRAQVAVDGALAGGLSRSRAARRGALGLAARRVSPALCRGLHGRARAHRDARAQRQRAPALRGPLQAQLDTDSRTELAALIEDYRRGLVPLVVPITLIRHHARQHGVAYLAGQTYLEPHPKELMLRNHG